MAMAGEAESRGRKRKKKKRGGRFLLFLQPLLCPGHPRALKSLAAAGAPRIHISASAAIPAKRMPMSPGEPHPCHVRRTQGWCLRLAPTLASHCTWRWEFASPHSCSMRSFPFAVPLSPMSSSYLACLAAARALPGTYRCRSIS